MLYFDETQSSVGRLGVLFYNYQFYFIRSQIQSYFTKRIHLAKTAPFQTVHDGGFLLYLQVPAAAATITHLTPSQGVHLLWQVSLTLTGPLMMLCQYMHSRRTRTRMAQHRAAALLSSSSGGTSSSSGVYCQYCSSATTSSLNRVVPWRRKNFSCSSAISTTTTTGTTYSSLSTLNSARMVGGGGSAGDTTLPGAANRTASS